MLTLVFLAFSGFSHRAGAEAGDKPNILFILIDDLGWKDLACQGNPHLHTPNIDGLAKQGVRFTDAYAAAPVCSPTRAALLTGLSPARLKITNHLPHQDRFTPEDSKLLPAEMADHLALGYTTIAERLKNEAGYATGFFGKWHLYSAKDSRYGPSAQGFDLNLGGNSFGGPPSFFDPYMNEFLPDRKAGEYLPDRLADETIAFMRKQSKLGKPFFAALFNYTVHWPMEAPEQLINKYKDRPLKGYHDHRYAAMIEAMDAATGRVLNALDAIGIANNTLVVFTSDNGPFHGVGDARPLRESKGYLYEGGIRVPLIVRWPGVVEPNTVSKVPVISTDFFPTLLEVAGLQPNRGLPADGESLVPLLSGKGVPEREALYWHYPNFAFHQGNRLGSAVRLGNHKLIENFDDGSIELYDLAHDIGETENLAEEKPALAARMKTMLAAWREQSGAAMPRARSPIPPK